MPRQPRLELPGSPLYITQRGVNRCAIFDDDDRCHFYRLLHEATAENAIAVHAYVFMGNHIHLLATPSACEALSRATRNFGQCYVQASNKRHGRCGPLWQWRFKSCLVDTERYLMTVYRRSRLLEARRPLRSIRRQERASHRAG
jgi:putative transposase